MKKIILFALWAGSLVLAFKVGNSYLSPSVLESSFFGQGIGYQDWVSAGYFSAKGVWKNQKGEKKGDKDYANIPASTILSWYNGEKELKIVSAIVRYDAGKIYLNIKDSAYPITEFTDDRIAAVSTAKHPLPDGRGVFC